MTFWDRFHNRRFTFDRFARGMRVLDVGFGEGEQMQALLDRGCEVTGVDYSFALVDQAKARGFNATQSLAENLPFPAAQFDGLICKVVVPYTDEARAIAEWARVLKPGGVAWCPIMGPAISYAT
ncbi:MAG: class I SAM-dependent methyltransferase [Gemmatimonadaceae bacterium]|nr:class I SAM-dependent methyltransferase [Gemmatimonadaceae bacterium]